MKIYKPSREISPRIILLSFISLLGILTGLLVASLLNYSIQHVISGTIIAGYPICSLLAACFHYTAWKRELARMDENNGNATVAGWLKTSWKSLMRARRHREESSEDRGLEALKAEMIHDGHLRDVERQVWSFEKSIWENCECSGEHAKMARLIDALDSGKSSEVAGVFKHASDHAIETCPISDIVDNMVQPTPLDTSSLEVKNSLECIEYPGIPEMAIQLHADSLDEQVQALHGIAKGRQGIDLLEDGGENQLGAGSNGVDKMEESEISLKMGNGTKEGKKSKFKILYAMIPCLFLILLECVPLWASLNGVSIPEIAVDQAVVLNCVLGIGCTGVIFSAWLPRS
ncbi:MAG: hypothetical protein ACTSUE_17815 [Promethearchaeota archaeon]